LAQVGALTWIATVWLTSIGMTTALVRSGTPFEGKNSICWALALAMLLEGYAFSVNVYDPGLLDLSNLGDLPLKAIFMLVQCTQAGLGWTKVLFLFRLTAAKPHTERIWTMCCLTGAGIGILGACFILSKHPALITASMGLFFLSFESYTIGALCGAIRLFLGAPDKYTGAFLLSIIGGAGLHFWQIYFTAIAPAVDPDKQLLGIKTLANCPFMFLQGVSLFLLSQRDTFTSPADGHVLLDGQAPLSGRAKHYVFPEYWFGLTFIPILLAYGVTFICLRLVTMPGLITGNPLFVEQIAIYRMYQTFHPCILLDYLPGTLFSQPLFDIVTIMSLLTIGLAWIRSACTGSFGILLGSTLSFVVALFTGPCFALVFTFSPDITGVLAHSVPYMAWEATVALFFVSQAYYVWACKDPLIGSTNKIAYLVYALIYLAIDMYGLNFMCTSLAGSLGYGPEAFQEKIIKPPGCHEATTQEEVDAMCTQPIEPCINGVCSTAVHFRLLPMLAAISTHLNQWLNALLSPMKYRPLGYEIICVDVTSPEADKAGKASVETVAESSDERVKIWHRSLNVFSFQLSARHMSAIASIIFAVSPTLAYKVSELTGNLEDGETLSDVLTTLPGTVPVVVLWMVAIIFFLLHCGIIYTHEKYLNPDKEMVNTTFAFMMTLVATLFLGHAASLPAYQTITPWFIGFPMFQLALIFWALLNLVLAIRQRKQPGGHAISDTDLLVDGASTMLLAFCLALSMTINITKLDAPILNILWVGALFIWSLCDSREVTLFWKNIHIATDEETKHALKEFTPWGVPGFLFNVPLFAVPGIFSSTEAAKELTA